MINSIKNYLKRRRLATKPHIKLIDGGWRVTRTAKCGNRRFALAYDWCVGMNNGKYKGLPAFKISKYIFR